VPGAVKGVASLARGQRLRDRFVEINLAGARPRDAHGREADRVGLGDPLAERSRKGQQESDENKLRKLEMRLLQKE
jgi:hypothetical protein